MDTGGSRSGIRRCRKWGCTTCTVQVRRGFLTWCSWPLRCSRVHLHCWLQGNHPLSCRRTDSTGVVALPCMCRPWWCCRKDRTGLLCSSRSGDHGPYRDGWHHSRSRLRTTSCRFSSQSLSVRPGWDGRLPIRCSTQLYTVAEPSWCSCHRHPMLQQSIWPR